MKKSLCYFIIFIILLAFCACDPALPNTAGQASVSPIYWNVDRMQASDPAGTPDENGVYTFRFVSDGKLISLKAADAQIAKEVGARDAMGLSLDANGLITDVVNIEQIAAGINENYHILKIDGDQVHIHYSAAASSMPLVIDIAKGVGIIDVRPDSDTLGQAVTPEIYDTVNVYSNADGEILAIFLLDRTDPTLPAFSYEEARKTYAPGTPGVITSGFVNTTETEITSANVVKQAQKECTVNWNKASASYDPEADVWMVDFWTVGIVGGGQSVYMDAKGKTLLIVYGE